eukprot:SAG11_NODE_2886_length_2867_cov_1.874277_7_plen_45_part_01
MYLSRNISFPGPELPLPMPSSQAGVHWNVMLNQKGFKHHPCQNQK